MIPDEWKLAIYLAGLVFVAGGAFFNLRRMDREVERLRQFRLWASGCLRVIHDRLRITPPEEP